MAQHYYSLFKIQYMQLQSVLNINDHPFAFICLCGAFLITVAFFCIRETAPKNTGDELPLTGEDFYNYSQEPNEHTT
jgi:hypothetical protein